MIRKPLDVDRTAWFLIRRYGDDSALVAFRRSQHCAARNDADSCREWRLVTRRVVELHFARPQGRAH